MRYLRELIARNRAGSGDALPSVCSAHPTVLTAALLLADQCDKPLLVEATSNQVNQFGGYTGMTPADFVTFIHRLCARCDVPAERVLLGGDHLGPQVWRGEDSTTAMTRAGEMISAYVRAGFTKIHLDCAEGCAGEPARPGDAIVAARVAVLAATAEAAADRPDELSYVFGTEVPPPGGARAGEEAHVTPTDPKAAAATIAAHEQAFADCGLAETAWPRAVGLVVQPGLEFSPDQVLDFPADTPDHLSQVIENHPGLAFEAHSTDYQKPWVYPELARRHFAVLKVGPALTFAYRQAVYALQRVLDWCAPGTVDVPNVMEDLMRADPVSWESHYTGSDEEVRLLRHFGYADRIRYYWAKPRAQAAIDALFSRLGTMSMPRLLIADLLPAETIERAHSLEITEANWATRLTIAHIQEALHPYFVHSR